MAHRCWRRRGGLRGSDPNHQSPGYHRHSKADPVNEVRVIDLNLHAANRSILQRFCQIKRCNRSTQALPDDKQQPPPIQLDAQITPGHVLEVIQKEVLPRLDRLEATVKESGLNGYSPYLKAFLEQYAATYSSRQAWLTVRSDIKHRLRWLAPGKRWLSILIAAMIGAVGWDLVGHLTGVHVPPPFG
jgi:hypothetical protein